jgi:riboflavin kinase/FMN adenylyltransferase
MLVFHFGAELASVDASDFVTDYLASRIGAAGVVTGEDFTFGKGRGGNVDVLKLLGQANRISVDAVAPVMDETGEPVSSSRVREALEAGDCETATRLLTRPFAIEGVVEHGDKRGRELGFPTANIPLGKYQRPRFGVYAVRGRLPDGRTLDGVANLGTRPMFDAKELLEPWFFDFDEEIYGQCVEVDLISFIRDELVFDDLGGLKAQIAADAAEARARLT